MSDKPELPLDNVFAVERCGDASVIIHKVPNTTLSRHEALLLAAWLIVQANAIPNPNSDLEFGDIIEQVEKLI